MEHSINTFSDGAAYEQYMGRWSNAVGAIFLDWVAPPQNVRWLDVGCGTGVFTELILERCSPAAVAAVDPSDAQIEETRGKPIAKRVDFRVADAQRLPFLDGTFDVVASSLVINFIPDRPRALAEMRRVVRPGGVVAGYVWDFAADGAPSSAVRFGLSQIGVKPPHTSGTEDSRLDAMTSLFSGASLRDIAARTIDVSMSFRNFEEFWQTQIPAFTPTGKVISNLSEADRKRLIEAVRGRLPAAHDGSITHSARANVIKARVPV